VKKRAILVSNSSTASYIALGFEAGDFIRQKKWVDDDPWDWASEHDVSILDGPEDGQDGSVICIKIFEVHSDGYGYESDLSDQAIREKLKKVQEEIGNHSKIQRYSGMRMA